MIKHYTFLLTSLMVLTGYQPVESKQIVVSDLVSNNLMTVRDSKTNIGQTIVVPSNRQDSPEGTSKYQPLTEWLDSYPVIIDNTNNPNTLYDYSVLVKINTAKLIAAGKMNADGSDIRFTVDNVNEIPYWIDPGIQNERGVGIDTTHIWVKIPEIPGYGQLTIYMLVGNPSASSTSDISSTFLFGDVFDDNYLDATKWDALYDNAGQIIEQNQRLEHNSPKTTPQSNSYLLSKQQFTGPMVLEMQFKKGGYVYRSVGLNKNPQAANYNVAYCQWQDYGAFTAGLFVEGNQTDVNFRDDDWSLVNNPEYYVKIIRHEDGTISFSEKVPSFEPGGPQFWATHPNTVMPLDSVLKVFAYEGVWVSSPSLLDRYEDNIRVRKYSEPEPTTEVVADVVTDYDGNAYNTVTIGDQVWLQQNLKVTHYRNGDAIESPSSWIGVTNGAYRWYNNDQANIGDTYGALYNWYAVTDNRGLCPTGWRAPTDEEFTELESYLITQGYSAMAQALAANNYWEVSTIDASPGFSLNSNNATGFTAVPAGVYDVNDVFYSLGAYNYLWTSSENTSNGYAWTRRIDYNSPIVNRFDYGKDWGYSARCIKDVDPLTVGLVAYYPFNGNANDESGNGNNGIENGGVALTTDRLVNQDNAYLFNGTDSYITTGSSTGISNAFTFSAWVNPQSISGRQYTILAERIVNQNYQFIIINQRPYCTVWMNGTEYSFQGNPIVLNVWQLLTVTYDGVTITFYVNGQFDSSFPLMGIVDSNTSKLYIGNIWDSPEHLFYGKIDEVRVYNRNLSQSEISQLYANYHAPDTLVAEPGDGQVTLRWSGERIAEIAQYDFYEGGVNVGTVNVAGPTDTTYTVTALNNYQPYEFYITSTDIYSNVSQPSDTVTVTPCEVVTDYDGNTYTTVQIGNQEWMAENLKTTKYNDGTPIPTGHTDEQWGGLNSGAYAIYPHADIDGFNSDTEVLEAYGALYNWFAVNDSRNICPAGWRVPAWEEDWNVLESFMYPESGAKLKSTRTYPLSHPRWDDPNSGATNEVGFSALPSGIRFAEGSYAYVGQTAFWWTSTIDENPWYKNINYNQTGFSHGTNWGKNVGFSVRCIKDSGAALPLVSTSAVTNITQTTATSGGNVTNDGGATVTKRGVVWNSGGNPTLIYYEGFTSDGEGIGQFDSYLTNLSASNTYYVRAYAINVVDTAYGEQVSFSTPANWVERNVYLSQGFTWISTNLFTNEMAVGDVFLNLQAANNDRVIGQTQYSIYNNGSWLGSLPGINPSQMYKVKLAQGYTHKFEGVPVSIEAISLFGGYTWLGYLPQGCSTVNDALTSIQPYLVGNERIIGQNSFAVYDYNQARWTGGLWQLCPGEGYIIHLFNDTQLTYVNMGKSITVSKSQGVTSPAGIFPTTSKQHTMMLIATVQDKGKSITLGSQDMVYAFSNGECRGMAPVNENGLVFMSIGSDGNLSDELIKFKIWHSASNAFYDVEESCLFHPLDELGTLANPFDLNIVNDVTDNAIIFAEEIFISEPQPNPFSVVTSINIEIKQSSNIRMKIYSITGILINQLVNKPFEPGRHRITVERSELKSGIYLYSVEVNNGIELVIKNGKLIVY